MPSKTPRPFLFALFTVAFSLTTAVSAQDIKGDPLAGEQKIAMCIGCHGIPGYKASFPEVYRVPMISRQGGKYIASALNAYKSGERKHPTMRSVAQGLTDQDIADVAAYYEGHGRATTVAEQPAAPNARVAELLTKGACQSCHGPNFTKPLDGSYPKIAGQNRDYLYVALKAYKNPNNTTWGRANPIMGGIVQQFSPAELKELADYIGTLPGEVRVVPQSKFR